MKPMGAPVQTRDAGMNTQNLLSLTKKVFFATVAVLAVQMAGNVSPAQAQTFDMTALTRAAAVRTTIAQVQNTVRQAGGPQLNITSTGVMDLPVVSTGSINLNTCDMPFLRSNGGSGAFPSAGGDGGTGGGSNPGGGDVGLPNLPPGYVGVQNTHTGAFMGAIPPGGNIVDFFRGAYGIQPGQEAEADYILHNQLQYYWQNGIFAGMWGPYEQSGPP